MKLHSTFGIRQTIGSLIVLYTLLGSAPLCKNLETESRWADSKIVIDGRTTDWPSVQGVYLSEQNAAFTFNNDGEFLYVLFRTTDLGWAQTIKMTGLTLYFDIKGGKKKDVSICYKGGPTMEQAMAVQKNSARNASSMPTPPTGQRPGGMQESQVPSLTCSIKDRITDKSVPLGGMAGPAAAFDTCQGFFTYEFRIPLAAGEGDYYGIGAKPGQIVSVGGIWGDMGEKASQGGPGGMGEPPSGGPGGGGMGGPGGGGGMGGPGGGGMGGPGGGGMGGPGGSAGGGEHPSMPQKQEVWIKATVAAPPTPAPVPSETK
jgi:hypothetical protein